MLGDFACLYICILLIYFENSNGHWFKREYDQNGNEIYYEDSDGRIVDKR